MELIDAKNEILKYYSRAYEDKLMAGTSGNASVFLPEAGIMAITPSGVDWRLLNTGNIVTMKLDGTVLDSALTPSSEWRMHAEIYKAVPEARAVMHTHSKSAAAFSVCGIPIPEILIEMNLFLGGEVPVAPFAPAGSQKLAEDTAHVLKDHPACLMRSHGVAAYGASMEQAYMRACYVEDSADIYLRARIIGNPIIL